MTSSWHIVHHQQQHQVPNPSLCCWLEVIKQRTRGVLAAANWNCQATLATTNAISQWGFRTVMMEQLRNVKGRIISIWSNWSTRGCCWLEVSAPPPVNCQASSKTSRWLFGWNETFEPIKVLRIFFMWVGSEWYQQTRQHTHHAGLSSWLVVA